jgi:phage terminase large subunit-like protein
MTAAPQISLAERMALLSEAERNKILGALSAKQLEALQYDWNFWARPSQIAPEGDWQVWLYLGGRGTGKTRSGCEWVRGQVESGHAGRLALIAPTTADVRDVIVEGPAGILACSKPSFRPLYEPSKRKLTWPNGAVAMTYSAEEPDRLRGPNHDGMLCDELAAWSDPEATWDMAMFGLRLGRAPQVAVTTTPRPIPIIRELLKSPNSVITRGTTYENAANLAPSFLNKIITKYEGTRLGRQELNAELIEEVEGALWTHEMIERCRVKGRSPDMRRVVIGVDPAVSSGGTSALTGIVAMGLGADGKGYVLSDRSGRYSPGEWAAAAVRLFDETRADRVVAEGNQGGEMVRYTLSTIRPNLPIKIVHASVNKMARAEPIAALSEQARIMFAGKFPELEDQLCTFAPLEGQPSPDRLDAFVWAATALFPSHQPMQTTGHRPAALTIFGR